MTRLAPLPIPDDLDPELRKIFDERISVRGFVPTALLIMQRKPRILKALRQLLKRAEDQP